MIWIYNNISFSVKIFKARHFKTGFFYFYKPKSNSREDSSKCFIFI